MRSVVPTLVGRDRELELIDELLGHARAGDGGVLTFSAEPGGGKTTLLEAAIARAEDIGFRVLPCCGIQWEAELPFSGLHELLRTLLPLMPALPDPQREGLDRAFARAAGPVEGLNVYVGALSLVLEATRQAPVLLVVDDLQWIDQATRQALAFLVRRLKGEPVVVLLAARPGAALDGAPASVQVPRLERDAVTALVRGRAGVTLSDRAADDFMRTTEGNPLAVIETLRVLGDELETRTGLFDEPPPVSELIERAFVGRVDALPADTRRVAELVAASVGQSDRQILDALAHLGVPPDALPDAARAGLLEHRDGRWRFAHPILRSVVHQSASPERRRAAHAALSAASSADPGLVAWHAASAANGPDEPTAAALEIVAERFGLGGGAFAAAKALERSAELTPDPDRHAARLLRASYAARSASGEGEWALSLVRAALDVVQDPALHVRAELEQAIIMAHTSAPALVEDPPLAVAYRALEIDHEVAATGFRDAAVDAVLAGEQASGARILDVLQTLAAGGRLSPQAQRETEVCIEWMRMLYGKEHGTDAGASGYGGRAGSDALEHGLHGWGSGVLLQLDTLLWAEEFAIADRVLETHHAWARSLGDVYGTAMLSMAEAVQAVRTGDWSRVLRCAEVASDAASPLTATVSTTAAVLKGVVAARRGAGLPDFAAIERTSADLGVTQITEWVAASRGVAALTAGDPFEAVEHFERAQDWQLRSGQVEPTLGTWPVDRVDALIQAGDPRAAGALEALRGHAGRGRRWALAAVPWFEGMLAGDEHFEAFFRESLERYPAAQAPFEEARARLAFAERLEKVGRQVDAGVQFAAALELFDQLKAEPWVARARAALGIAPASAPPAEAHDRDALTPQERQVAELVARGASNKQAAGELFLSPKTIEAHLSRIYRKLGITSRTQLAARWGELSDH